MLKRFVSWFLQLDTLPLEMRHPRSARESVERALEREREREG